MVAKKKVYNNKELTKRDTVRIIPRTAFIDAMVEKADKEPRDIKLQREMLHPRISPFLTHAERERYRKRVKWYEGMAKRKLDPGLKEVMEGIDSIVNGG